MSAPVHIDMGHTPYSVPISLPHESIDEARGFEGCEVVGPLTQPDELDGHAELLLHLHDDASLGRTVQLGQDDTGDVDDLGEDAGLGCLLYTSPSPRDRG